MKQTGFITTTSPPKKTVLAHLVDHEGVVACGIKVPPRTSLHAATDSDKHCRLCERVRRSVTNT